MKLPSSWRIVILANSAGSSQREDNNKVFNNYDKKISTGLTYLYRALVASENYPCFVQMVE